LGDKLLAPAKPFTNSFLNPQLTFFIEKKEIEITKILSTGVTPLKTFLHGNDIILLFSHKRFSHGGS
jgi:hypothetical protein